MPFIKYASTRGGVGGGVAGSSPPYPPGKIPEGGGKIVEGGGKKIEG